MRKNNSKLIGLIICSFIFSSSATFSVQLKQSHPEPIKNLRKSPENNIEIDLINYYNSQYTGTMVMGSNNQSFNLIFDTSSPWLWVLESAPNSKDVQSTSKFDCLLSSSCRYAKQITGDFMMAEYFAFSKSVNIEGIIASDYISFPNSRVLNQSFLIMSEEHADLLSGYSVDGICGLGPKNDKKMPTFLNKLKKEGLIEKEIFSLYLHNNPEAYDEEGSEIIFGGMNETKKIGKFVTVSARDSLYWEANLDNIFLSVGNTSSRVEKVATYVVFDSGINTLKMAQSDFLTLIKKLKQDFGKSCSYFGFFEKVYACECPGGDIDSFPNITFVINGQVLPIPPSQYLMVRKDNCVLLMEGSPILEFPKKESQEDENNGQSDKIPTDPENFLVLGTPFLRNYYTVFNVENKTISFAQAMQNTKKAITTLELIYMVFGIFIFILFCALVTYATRIWTNKNKNAKKESVTFDNIITEGTERMNSTASYRPINFA